MMPLRFGTRTRFLTTSAIAGLAAFALFPGTAFADCTDHAPTDGSNVTCGVGGGDDTVGVGGGANNVTVNISNNGVINANPDESINLGTGTIINMNSSTQILNSVNTNTVLLGSGAVNFLATNGLIQNSVSGGTALNFTGSGSVNVTSGNSIVANTFADQTAISMNGGDVTLSNGGIIAAQSGGTAINFGSSNGTLTLAPGGSLTGNVIGGGANDTLVLGGSGTQTFDTDTIGTQFQGFDTYKKTGSSTWTLGGTTEENWNLVGGTLIGTTDNIGDVADSGALRFTQNADGTYSGTITGIGSVEKYGSGTVTLDSVNDYSGGTTIAQGSLIVNADNHLGNATGGLSINGGTLIYGAAFDTARAIDIGVDNGTIDTNGNNVAMSGNIGGGGRMVKTGTGTLTLTGTNSYSLATVSAGTLTGTTSAIVGTITDNASVTIDQNTTGTLAATINGTGSLTKTGSGNVTLGGSYAYSGGTFVEDGTLTGDTTTLQGDITNDATVTFNQTTNGIYAGDMDGTGALIKTGGGDLTLTGTNSYSGGTTISTGALVGSVGSIQGDIVDNANLRFTGGGNFADNISGTGNVAITGATVTFSGTNTYQGSTDLTSSSTLILSDANSLKNTSVVTIDQSAIQFGSAFTTDRDFAIGNNDATFNTNGHDDTISGNITGGTGKLTKTGTGTLTLTGTNSYGDGTVISAGTLAGTTDSLQGDISDNATLKFDQATTGTYTGNITGSGALVKDGVGNVTLVGTNNYSGGTTVTGGTLTGNASSLQGNITDNATLAFNQTTTGTYAGNITGTGSLVKLGTGDLTLSGTGSNYSGGTTISAGRLIGDASTLQGNIQDDAALRFDQTTDASYAGDISGTGGVEKTGVGFLTLTGTNSYHGGTTVSAGGVEISDDTSLGASDSDINLDGGTLRFGAAFTSTRDMTIGTGDGTIDTNSFDDEISGDIGGTGVLTKSGTGTLTLTGTNNYSGGTVISAGTLAGTADALQGDITDNATLQFTDTTDGTSTSNITGSGALVKTGAGNVTLNGTNTYSGGTTVSDGTITGTTDSLQGDITNNAIVTFDQSGDGIYAGDMDGTGALVKDGNGTVTMTGTNTYSGGTTINGGMLAGDVDAIQGDITNNATLNLTGTGTFADDITGTGDLLIDNTSAIELSGNNDFTGNLGIVASTVTVDDAAALSDAALVLVTDGTFKFGSAFTTDRDFSIVNIGTSTLTFDTNGHDAEVSGNIGGASGKIDKTGTGTLTLSGTNTYSGGTTISAGTLAGTTDSLQGDIADNATLKLDQSTDGAFTGDITGSGSFIKDGTGNVTLSGANTYSGGTTVSDGTLTGDTTSLQGDITNNAGVVFDQSTTGTYAGDMDGTGALTIDGGGNVTLTGTNTYTGGTTITSGTLTGALGSIQGDIDNNGSLVFDGGTGIYADNLTGTGNVLVQNFADIELSGDNDFTGNFAVNGASVQIDDAGALSNASLVSLNSATLAFGSAFTFDRDILIDVDDATFDTNGHDVTLSGDVGGGAGKLIKDGAGTLTLTGTSSYADGNTISAGTLAGTTDSILGDVLDNGTLKLDQSADGAFTGDITGSGSFIKDGTGNVTLSGTNTYSGGTTVSDGTLTGTTDSLQGDITNNATVAIAQNGSGIYAGDMDGTGAVTVDATLGGNTIRFSGTNTYSGGTTITNAILIGDLDALQGDMDVGTGGTLELEGNGIFADDITGTGDVLLDGDIELSGNNDFTGTLGIDGSTVTVDDAGALSDALKVVATDGTFKFGSAFTTDRNFVINSFGTDTFTIDTNGHDSGISGNISDFTGGALVKTGTGTLTLSGTNTYTGGTTISAGTLAGTTDSLQGDITDNATLTFDQATDGTFADDIIGTGALVKDGAGAVTLSGTNTYSGGTTINGGFLIGTTDNLQGDVLINSGGLGFNQTTDGTFAGDITGAGGVVKADAGNLTLTGSNAYTGGTSVLDGTLTGDTDSLQGLITADTGTFVVLDQATDGNFTGHILGGTFIKDGAGNITLTGLGIDSDMTIADGTITGTTTTIASPRITDDAALVFDQSTNGAYAGDIDGTGTLTIAGTGTVTLSGTNTYSGGTTVSAGTLQGTTDSLQGDITNDATVTFNQTTNGAYAGDITGTGALVKSGTGNVTLTGTGNAYTGGTTVSGGTLTGNTTSLQGDIANDASIVFDDATGGTYAGNITGNGDTTFTGGGAFTVTGSSASFGTLSVIDGTSLTVADPFAFIGGAVDLADASSFIIGDDTTLNVNFDFAGAASTIDTGIHELDINGNITGTGLIKQGSGDLVLSGTNTIAQYTVEAGRLIGTTDALQGDITNNADVVFDQSADGTYAGDMDGTGALTITNTGIVTLSGANTYTGGTSIDASAGLVGTTGSLQGNIDVALNGDLSFDQTTNGTYAGELTGTGDLHKIGTGRVSLTTDSIGFTGFSFVGAGTLAVNADYSGTWVDVASGATLGGSGTVGAAVINSGGSLAPGNSIGTLYVDNLLTFQAGSTYVVETNDAGQSDQTIATGTITIAGGTVEARPIAGVYGANITYTILQGGNIAGMFVGATSTSAFLDPTLSYTNTTVDLTLTRNDIALISTALDQGQTNTAEAINALGAGNAIYDSIVPLSGTDSANAYNSFGGEHIASFGATALQSAGEIHSVVSSRVQNVIYGHEGTASTLGNLAPAAGASDDDKDSGIYNAALIEPSSDAPPPMDQIHSWMSAFGTTGHSAELHGGDSYSRGSTGFIAGIDRNYGAHSYIGGYAGYENAQSEFSALRSSSQLENYHAGVYGVSTLGGGWNVSGMLGGIYHNADTVRYIVFPGFSAAEHGDTNGGTISASAEVSKSIALDDFALAPYAGMSLTYTHMNGYTESGSAADLSIDAQNTFTPSSVLGFRAAHKFQQDDKTGLTLRTDLGWQHNFGDLKDESSMRFASGGTSNFTVYGPGRTRDALNVGLGLDLDFKNTGANAFIDYAGTLSDRTQDHALTAGFKWKF